MMEQQLPGTVWRLAFTTETALPRDATAFLEFHPNEETLKYGLEFGKKTLGLNRLDASCRYSVLNVQDKNNNYKDGSVTFVYDKITMDAFGLKAIDVCFFGLLKGRTNGIDTAYYDGSIWIEEQQQQQQELSTTDGVGRPSSSYTNKNSMWNVYVREDVDAWRK